MKTRTPAAPAELLDLLRGARQANRDAAPRLVLADWLDDHGQGERADFIRLQCALARLPWDDPGREGLEARERALLDRYAEGWLRPLRGVLGRWEFHRGMLHALGDISGLLRRSAARLADSEPWAWVVRLRAAALTARQAEGLADCPLLGTLAVLDLTNSGIWAGPARRLVASPHLGGLDRLDLSWNGLGSLVVEALARAAQMPRLTRLTLAGNRLDDRAAQALASWPGLAGLAELHLGHNQIGDAGAIALAGSPHLEPPTLLDLRHNRIGAGAWVALRSRMGECAQG